MSSYSSFGTLLYAGYEIKNGRFYNLDGTLASSSSVMTFSFSNSYAYLFKVSNGSSVNYYTPGETSFPSSLGGWSGKPSITISRDQNGNVVFKYSGNFSFYASGNSGTQIEVFAYNSYSDAPGLNLIDLDIASSSDITATGYYNGKTTNVIYDCQTINVSAKITNKNSTWDAGDFQAVISLNGSSRKVVGSGPEAGESSTVTASFGNLTPGTYTVTVKSPDNANHTCWGTLNYLGALGFSGSSTITVVGTPDLSMASISAVSEDGTSILNNREKFNLTVGVLNSGTGASDSYTVSLYLNGALWQSAQVNSTEKNSISYVTFVSDKYFDVGSYSLSVKINESQSQFESNYANNTNSSYLVINKWQDRIAPILTSVPQTSVSDRTVTISGYQASDNIGVTGYKIRIDGNTYKTTQNTFSQSGLRAGKHSYQICAYDEAGNISDWTELDYFTVYSADVGFYTPVGWSDSLVLSDKSGTNTGCMQVTPGDDVYIDWAIRNSGNLSDGTVTVSLYLDGASNALQSWTFNADAEKTETVLDYCIDGAMLSEGKHTLTLSFVSNSNSETITKSFSVQEQTDSEFKLNGNEYAYISVPGLTASDFVYTNTSTGGSYAYAYTDTKGVIYDAEKTGISASNAHTVYEMCCWAATTANMYIKAGYGKSGSQVFANEDDLLQYIIEHADKVPCEDLPHNYMDGAFTSEGFKWLFTGVFDARSWNISGGGFYEKTIDANNMSQYFLYAQNILGFSTYYNAPSAITNMPGKNFSHDMFLYADQCLRENYSVGLSISFDVFENKTENYMARQGGHAITVYGFTYDKTKDKNNDPNYYTGLIVADSDDDKSQPDSTAAPDRLKILPIEWNQTYQYYILKNYGKYEYSNGYTQKGVIDGMEFLAPCTENSIAVQGTTGNNVYSWNVEQAFSNVTFGNLSEWSNCAYSVGMNAMAAQTGNCQHLVAGEDIYLAVQLENLAGTAPAFDVSFTVYDIYGETVSQKRISVDGLGANSTDELIVNLGALPIGFYTGIATIHYSTMNEQQTSNKFLPFYIGSIHETISSGDKVIENGESVSNYTVSNGQKCYIRQNGALLDSTLNAGTVYVQNGAVNNVSVGETSVLFIERDGCAEDVVVTSGGVMTMEYGTANNITVNGIMFVDKDALAQNITVNADGGLSSDYNGRIDNVKNYGQIMVVEGGNGENITNYGNSSLIVGSTSDLTPASVINSDFYGTSKQKVSDFGTAEKNTFFDANSGQLVSGEKAIARNNVFKNSGIQEIDYGGTVSESILYNNSQQWIFEGTAYDTTLNASTQTICAKGAAYDTIINNNGISYVFGGAVAVDTVVESGGCLVAGSIYDFGAAGTIKNAVINSGGLLRLQADATLSGTITVAGNMEVTGQVNTSIEGITGTIPYLNLIFSGRKVTDSAMITGMDYLPALNYEISIDEKQQSGTYEVATNADAFTGRFSLKSSTNNYGNLQVNSNIVKYEEKKYQLTQVDGKLLLTVNTPTVDAVLTGSENGLSWLHILEDEFTVEFSADGFESTFKLNTENVAVDMFGLPEGDFQWRVSGDGKNWQQGNNIISSLSSGQSQHWISDADNNMDVFFARANGKWSSDYAAQHTGISEEWNGTNEQVKLSGKNKISDIFEGSSDANILLLSDDVNGDAVFVDDIYTALPGTVAEQQARIAKIDEIRVGAGDDIIDMTSQLFAYVGNGVKIYGGLGNDTIWANNGNNTLFGDAGNDRMVGGSDNDLIIGGIGNDSMHGGGGDDIFTFGGTWGNDTVEQLSGGSVTLWFESGSENNWNASTLTYTDGANSVKVSGITANNITLKFGDDGSLLYDELSASGCFEDIASEKIFEDKNKGVLA